MIATDMEIRSEQVTLRPATLLEAWIVALESGEFRQTRYAEHPEVVSRYAQGCAWQVGYAVCRRAGMQRMTAWQTETIPVADRAGALLGYRSLVEANDQGGVPFPQIAAALRQARAEVFQDAQDGVLAAR